MPQRVLSAGNCSRHLLPAISTDAGPASCKPPCLRGEPVRPTGSPAFIPPLCLSHACAAPVVEPNTPPQDDILRRLDQSPDAVQTQVTLGWYNDVLGLEMTGSWAGVDTSEARLESRRAALLAVYQVRPRASATHAAPVGRIRTGSRCGAPHEDRRSVSLLGNTLLAALCVGPLSAVHVGECCWASADHCEPVG